MLFDTKIRSATEHIQPGLLLLQEVPEGRKESPGGPWKFIGLMPLFDPPRHDSAETIRRALNLGVNVKMITGEHMCLMFRILILINCFSHELLTVSGKEIEN